MAKGPLWVNFAAPVDNEEKKYGPLSPQILDYLKQQMPNSVPTGVIQENQNAPILSSDVPGTLNKDQDKSDRAKAIFQRILDISDKMETGERPHPMTIGDLVTSTKNGYIGEDKEAPKNSILGALGGLASGALNYLGSTEGQTILGLLSKDPWNQQRAFNRADQSRDLDLRRDSEYQRQNAERASVLKQMYDSQASHQDFTREMYKDPNNVVRWGLWNKRTGEHIRDPKSDPEVYQKELSPAWRQIEDEEGQPMMVDLNATKQDQYKVPIRGIPMTDPYTGERTIVNPMMGKQSNKSEIKSGKPAQSSWTPAQREGLNTVEKEARGDKLFQSASLTFGYTDRARALLNQGKRGIQALQTTLLRAAGEVGNNAVAEQQGLAGPEDLKSTIIRKIASKTYGEWTAEDKKYFNELIDAFENNAKKNMQTAIDSATDSFTGRYEDADPDKARKYFQKVLGGRIGGHKKSDMKSYSSESPQAKKIIRFDSKGNIIK